VYSKNYDSELSEAYRFSLWLNNFKFIQELSKDSKHTFQVGLNQYSDMTKEEWKTHTHCIVVPKHQDSIR